MRDRITTALEITGLASVVLSAFLVDVALGFAALGATLLAVGVLEGRR